MKYFIQGLVFTFLLNLSACVEASQYFKAYDFENERSTETLQILDKFKTFQQTTDYSCAAVCVQMLEAHYKKLVHTEAELIKLMNINPYTGVTTEQLAKFLQKKGWQVEKSGSKYPINSYQSFIEFTEKRIANGEPICVESALWGGHWRIIIGLDKRGTDETQDDVLVFADPMDIADDKRDGYTIVNAQQFFYSWFDANMGPTRRIRQWVIVK